MPLRLLLSGGHRRLCMRREDKMELRQSRPLYKRTEKSYHKNENTVAFTLYNFILIKYSTRI